MPLDNKMGFMDVPKAFDTTNHKLQITNLHKKYKNKK